MRFSRAALALVLMAAPALTLQASKPTHPAKPQADAKTDTKPDQPEGPAIDWHPGPFNGDLGGVGQFKIPAGFRFADGNGARRFLELTGNPASKDEVGIVTPILGKNDPDSKFYFILFEFSDSGYVRDDEKAKIDAPKLLKSMQDGTEEENKERVSRGWTPYHLTGWVKPPFYDNVTHNLTWATVGVADDDKKSQSVNYNTRILGRRGVMRVDLVLDPAQVDTVVPTFNSLLTGFTYTQGSRYADFMKGDKVAEYGLTALIAGGATAVALKTGLFTKLLGLLAALWKVIAVAFAALLTRIKNIFAAIKRKFGGRSADDDTGQRDM